MADDPNPEKYDAIIETIKAELAKTEPTRRQRIMEAIALAALGSIPWVGGVLTATATFKFDESSAHGDTLRNQWLHEHHNKLRSLQGTLEEVLGRIQSL